MSIYDYDYDMLWSDMICYDMLAARQLWSGDGRSIMAQERGDVASSGKYANFLEYRQWQAVMDMPEIPGLFS